MSSPEHTTVQLYLKSFPPDEVEALERIVDVIRTNKDSFVQQWRELCASLFGAHLGCPEQLFQERYVPYLRSAVLRLSDGDGESFWAFSGILGEHLAAADVPFSVLVAHLNLLKESCVSVLAAQVGESSRITRLTIDKLTACCISAAADSYYRRVNGPPRVVVTPDRPEASAPSIPPLRGVFHGMVGRCPEMQQVFEQIRRLAQGIAPVLIAGETGTGKELIARAIHNEGSRSGGPFVAVNCAALPGELIESELFGYRRGAFSGAVTDHVGLFRAASGGTLFLDEITEMSRELQAKLLRVVQERAVRPLGSVTEVPIDCRIITSTNRDPHEILTSRVLRSDLYYRLCVSMITVPPLRERGDDIMLLVEHHMSGLNEHYGHSLPGVRGLTADAMAEILARDWPGNVRELFNALEDAFTRARALHINPADLPLARLAVEPAAAGTDADAETFAAAERALIARALIATQGNKVRAARYLGISRKKLYAKLAKYTVPILLLSHAATSPVHAPVRGTLVRRSPACSCVIAAPRSRSPLAPAS
jgi:DNA-binding NtrC family response regulator